MTPEWSTWGAQYPTPAQENSGNDTAPENHNNPGWGANIPSDQGNASKTEYAGPEDDHASKVLQEFAAAQDPEDGSDRV